jgi:Domain of unknown function (DUF4266)
MKAPRRVRIARRLLSLVFPAALLLSATGCAVQAYQRERLVDRIMTFESDAKEDARMTKSLEAREGSTGGNGGAGGGCACN